MPNLSLFGGVFCAEKGMTLDMFPYTCVGKLIIIIFNLHVSINNALLF